MLSVWLWQPPIAAAPLSVSPPALPLSLSVSVCVVLSRTSSVESTGCTRSCVSLQNGHSTRGTTGVGSADANAISAARAIFKCVAAALVYTYESAHLRSETTAARVPAPVEEQTVITAQAAKGGASPPCRHFKIQSCCCVGSAFDMSAFQTQNRQRCRWR